MSLGPERWLIVLVCYLDDKGQHPQSPITTLAGYALDWRPVAHGFPFRFLKSRE